MISDSPLPSEYGYDAYGAFNCAGEQMPVHEDSKYTVNFIEKCQREGKPFFINMWIHEIVLELETSGLKLNICIYTYIYIYIYICMYI